MLAGDRVFKALVVQRSRAYVKKSQEQQGGSVAMFPTREPPSVAEYSVKRTYGRLLAWSSRRSRRTSRFSLWASTIPWATTRATTRSVDPFDEEPPEAGLRFDSHPVPQAIREFRLRIRAVLRPSVGEASRMGRKAQRNTRRKAAIGSMEGQTRRSD